LNLAASAAALVLRLLYANTAPLEKLLSTQDRNDLIRARHALGETLEALAQEFNLSVQRVHQIFIGDTIDRQP